MNNINIYALTNLRLILNNKIYTTDNFNQLLDIIKNDTGCDIISVDYLSHKFVVYSEKSTDNNILIRKICTSLCKFLNMHKLDVEICVDEIERIDEKEEIRILFNNILIGNYVHMLMVITDISKSNNSEIIINL